MHRLPPVLTEASWNKNKGTIAKMAGETGIGAQMKKVDTAYNKIVWAKFDAAAIGKTATSAQDVDDAVDAAKKHFTAVVEPLRTELRKLGDLATETEKKFAKNKLIPKSSTQHVGTIAKTAKDFAVELKSFDAEMAAIEKLKGTLKTLNLDSLVSAKFWPIFKKLGWFQRKEGLLLATDPRFTMNLVTNQPDKDLVKLQVVAKQRIAEAAAAFKTVKAQEGKSLPKKDIKTKFLAPSHLIFDSFGTMGPPGAGEFGGMRGLLGYWAAIQGNLIKGHDDKRSTPEFKVILSYANFLEKTEEILVNQLEEEIDKLDNTL